MNDLPAAIGPYRITGLLGRGGMGTVYQAEHGVTGRRLALKSIHVRARSSLSAMRREIRALGRLSHPGVVKVFDEGEHEGSPWVAMELLEGATLRTLLFPSSRTGALEARSKGVSQTLGVDRSGLSDARGPKMLEAGETLLSFELSEGSIAPAPALPLPVRALIPRQARSYVSTRPSLRGQALLERFPLLGIISRVCSALAYLHGEGLVHRDLKPENIWIRPDGTPVLMDFGLAVRYAGVHGREGLEWDSHFAGTPDYLAPEQVSDEPIDPRTDLYALGCVLFEILVGSPPFRRNNVGSTIACHLSEPPQRPSDLVEETPDELDRLVLALLEKRPEDRPGYAQDVALVLERLGLVTPGFVDAPAPKPYLFRPRFRHQAVLVSRLDEALTAALRGEGQLLYLTAESGGGKTRLSSELARHATRRGFCVLAGACPPPAGNNLIVSGRFGGPLHSLRAPFQEAVDLLGERGSSALLRVFGDWGQLLSRWFPSLLGLKPSLRPVVTPSEPAAALGQLFLAIQQTLTALSRELPLLLILDDIHWADDLTIGFLNHLQRTEAVAHQHLVLLATVRSEDDSPVRHLLEQAEVLRIERLPGRVVGEIVRDMLALRTRPDALLRGLVGPAAGNPFFVGELLRSAVEQGLLRRNREGRWEEHTGEILTPDSSAIHLSLSPLLVALLLQRLHSLEASTREVVDAVAILGPDASLALLPRLTGLEAQALGAALADAERRVVLEVRDNGSLQFAHDTLREAALSTLSLLRRRRLHKIAAEVLEGLPLPHTPDRLASLGRHSEEAGDLARATQWYLEAARSAAAAYALPDSAALYRQALALPDASSDAGLWLEFVESVLMKAERLDEARTVLQSPPLATPAECPLVYRHQVKQLLATIEVSAGRPDEALPLAREALELARAAGDAKGEARSLFTLGRAQWQRSMETGRVNIEEGSRRLLEVASRSEWRASRHWLASKLLELCRLEEAAAVLEEAALNYVEEDEAAVLRAQTTHGMICVLSRDWEKAWEILGPARERARAFGMNRQLVSILNSLAAYFHYHLNSRTEACRALWEAAEVARAGGNWFQETAPLANLARFLAERTEPDELDRIVHRLRDIHTRTRNELITGTELQVSSLIHMLNGRLSEARANLTEAQNLYQTSGYGQGIVQVQYVRAVLARRQGDLEEARSHLEKSRTLLKAIPMPLSLATMNAESALQDLAEGRPFQEIRERLSRLSLKEGGIGTERPVWVPLARALETVEAGGELIFGECPDVLPRPLLRAMIDIRARAVRRMR